MTTTPPRIGELVEVIAPHFSKGARGVVVKKHRANADYRARAVVKFEPPYGQGIDGTEVIALDMLVAIR